jgi:hypothetical protein
MYGTVCRDLGSKILLLPLLFSLYLFIEILLSDDIFSTYVNHSEKDV